MSTKSKYSPNKSKSPFEFQWAAFCQKILNADGAPHEKTLVGITNDVSAKVEVTVPLKGKIRLNLGNLCLFAVFKRAKGVEGALNETVDLDIGFPAGPQKGKIELNLLPEHRYGQLQVNIQTILVELKPPQDRVESEISVVFNFGNKEIGSARLPILLDITYAGSKK